MKYKYNIKNLDCANCAKTIENKLNEDKNIKKAIVNFNSSTVTVETDLKDAFTYIKKIVSEIEPDAILSEDKIKENKNIDIYRIVLGGLIGLIGIVLKLPNYLNTILIIVAYIILIYKTLLTAIKQLRKKVINENFLVTISALGAFALGDSHEGLMVLFLYDLGKVLESMAVNKSRNSVAELMDIKEETSNLKENNKIIVVPTTEIKVGDIIVVKEGERVPLDGTIVKGSSMLDTSALTGESLPISVKVGDNILSGSINKGGLLEVKVTSIYKDSTVNKILELVETATERKTKTEKVVSKYSSKYTLGVIIIALLTATLLPLFTNLTYSESIYKGLTILVISCPCAIAISIPLSYFSGIGASSREGILVKGSNYLDSIKNIKEIAFDKTGTITTGEFYISKINIHNKEYTEDKIMEIFAKGESLSNHPIAKSVLKKYNKEVSHNDIKDFKEVSGKGIEFTYKKDKVKIGNPKYCGIKEESSNIYLTINNSLVADIEIKDEIKSTAKATITKLKNMGIKVHMFTGDSKEKTLEISKELNIEDVNYSMLPSDKYNYLEKLINNKKENTIVAFVGDGINDAPSLASANIGVAISSGTDIANNSASVILMSNNLMGIIYLMKISKKTIRNIKQNLFWAFFYNICMIPIATGIFTKWGINMNPMIAGFAMTISSLTVVFNALRLRKIKLEEE